MRRMLQGLTLPRGKPHPLVGAVVDYPPGQKQVHTLKPINSKADDLLQLVDVLLGAKTSTATAIAKVQLANYVREKLGENMSVFVVNPEYMKKNKQRQRHNKSLHRNVSK